MAVYEVFLTHGTFNHIYAFAAESEADAEQKYLGMIGNDATWLNPQGVRLARHDLPTVGEVFELIEHVKTAVKDLADPLRILARDFRRALNNWREDGTFGTGKMGCDLYKPYTPDFSAAQIPPEAERFWYSLKNRTIERGIY